MKNIINLIFNKCILHTWEYSTSFESDGTILELRQCKTCLKRQKRRNYKSGKRTNWETH